MQWYRIYIIILGIVSIPACVDLSHFGSVLQLCVYFNHSSLNQSADAACGLS